MRALCDGLNDVGFGCFACIARNMRGSAELLSPYTLALETAAVNYPYIHCIRTGCETTVSLEGVVIPEFSCRYAPGNASSRCKQCKKRSDTCLPVSCIFFLSSYSCSFANEIVPRWRLE